MWSAQAEGRRRRQLYAAFGFLLVTAFAALIGSALAGKGDTRLISRQSASAGGQGGDANSSDASVSRNGRFVAFTTDADNLGGPANDVTNTYVYDTETRKVRLVSRQSASAGGDGADQSSFDPWISANGRFVTFLTDADNLGGPAQDVTNIYVYDREERKILLVSRRSASAGGGGADADSGDPTLSGGGRFVTFRTDADNLGGPINDVLNVYVYDRKAKRIRLVSRQSAAAGGNGADQNSSNPSISGNGRLVAFDTDADNLGGPAQDFRNIYVYDTERKRVSLVSRQSASAGGDGGDQSSRSPTMAVGGRFVVFTSDADNLGGPAQDVTNVYVYDRKAKRIRLVSRQSSVAGGDGADQDSFSPSISGDGRFAAFATDSDNLGGPIQNFANVYAYDAERKRVRLVSRQSRSAGGDGGDNYSAVPAVSASGRFVAFETQADNLGGPIQDVLNIYRHDLLGP